MTQDEQRQLDKDKRQEEADLELETHLNKLFRKAKHTLRTDEKAFLQARKSYLTGAQLEEYKEILAEKLPRPDGEIVEEALEEKTRPVLDALAAELGIVEPEKFKNKAALIEAIEAAQKNQPEE